MTYFLNKCNLFRFCLCSCHFQSYMCQSPAAKEKRFVPCQYKGEVKFWESEWTLSKEKERKQERRLGGVFCIQCGHICLIQALRNIWRVSWYAAGWVILLRCRDQFLELLLTEQTPSPPLFSPASPLPPFCFLSVVVIFLFMPSVSPLPQSPTHTPIHLMSATCSCIWVLLTL